MLKGLGYRVSLDTFDEETALKADKAGIDLYLSVNGSNMDLADKMSCPSS